MAKRRHYHAHETAGEDARDGLPLAFFWQRAVGFVIDFFAVIVIWVPIIMAWRFVVTKEWKGQTNLNFQFDPREHETFLFMFVYFAMAQFLGNGQTPGKWICRTRVVSLTKKRMGFWQSIERGLGYGASMLEGGFGFVQFFLNRNRMCVHDRIAETIVVDVRRSARRVEEETNAEAVAG